MVWLQSSELRPMPGIAVLGAPPAVQAPREDIAGG